MSKTKQKNKSELEHLRGLVRELTAENRSLKKEIRRFEKYEKYGQDEEFSNDSEDTHVELEVKLTKDCTECGKGKVIQTLEIMNKVYGTCNVCGTNDRIK